ncbi:hypothetical protein BIV57_17905 [Mangrovactinospora gilvigrisea]|uniref:Uncharacterized protein n=1 Tax=Mangrovactinospora gilvigrisea TaxID=1428644 RepID=A0A1J7C3J3_9ACTN|nr:hypothetical protein [Mangrovactinospora gilvigrisea]OIV36112.1 hypothetical protein BIV57_17905 [Mangrovactinospora gilvigrisea]
MSSADTQVGRLLVALRDALRKQGRRADLDRGTLTVDGKPFGINQHGGGFMLVQYETGKADGLSRRYAEASKSEADTVADYCAKVIGLLNNG